MTKHIRKDSGYWYSLPWKKFRQSVFCLQTKIYKAVEVNDMAKCLSLQKLLFNSYAARMLAIRQVTQLNQGKKTAGIDGKLALNFTERIELEKILKSKAKQWKHQKLRKINIPKKNEKVRPY